MRFRLASTTGNPARFVALDDLEVICVPPLLDGYTGAPDECFPLTGTSHAAPHVAGGARRRSARLLARGTRTVSPGRSSLRAGLTRYGRARLRPSGRLRATHVLRFTPASGAPVTREARVILRR